VKEKKMELDRLFESYRDLFDSYKYDELGKIILHTSKAILVNFLQFMYEQEAYTDKRFMELLNLCVNWTVSE
jgi:hypothetical protein